MRGSEGNVVVEMGGPGRRKSDATGDRWRPREERRRRNDSSGRLDGVMINCVSWMERVRQE